jgi:hypothetical protein
MKYNDDDKQDHNTQLRNFVETTAGKTALWIDDDSGQIVDSISNKSRIRPGADCKRHVIATSQQRRIDQRPRFVDLVGRSLLRITRKNSEPILLERPPRLLLGFSSENEVDHDRKAAPHVPKSALNV